MQAYTLDKSFVHKINAPQELRNLISLFLCELLRSRKISLSRAAEVAYGVIEKLSEITNESEALSFLGSLEKDYEEVLALKQALHFGYKEEDVHVYEKEIREYAASLFDSNMVVSSSFLHDAADPRATIQTLCLKYPDFCTYLIASSDKGDVFKKYQAVLHG